MIGGTFRGSLFCYRIIKMKKILFLLPFISLSTLVGCSTEPSMTFKEEDSYYYYENYKYGPAMNERNLMDVMIPKNITGESGLVLYIHGGGWTAGDKRFGKEEAKRYIDKGLVFAAINYRYAADKVHNQDIMDDITLSLSKIKEIGLKYDINLEKAALFGGSAGAHLSLQYSYTQREVAPIKPVVAMSLSGPTDLMDDYYYGDTPNRDAYLKMFTKLTGESITPENRNEKADILKSVSPLYQVNKKDDAVPTIIAHGGKDDVVPLSNAESLKNRLNEVGQKFDYFYLPNSGHGLESDPEISTQFWNCFDQYLQTYVLGYIPE